MGWQWYFLALALIAAAYRLRRLRRRQAAPGPLRDWFKIRWDADRIFIDVRTDRPWNAEILWAQIERVCLKMDPDEYRGVSSSLYIWVKGRPQSYVIPIDADGGDALMLELPKRGLVTHDLIIRAMSSVDGLFCWPER